MLARLARRWQAQRRGEIPEGELEARVQAYEARLYDKRIEQAKRENDQAFFRKLSRALKALKDSPEGLAVKLSLAGRVIKTAQLLHGQGRKPTPAMMRDQLEREQGRRISDRQWHRLQALAKEIVKLIDVLSANRPPEGDV